MSQKRSLLLAIAIISVGFLTLRAGLVRQLTAETEEFSSQAGINWSHLSSDSGDLPVPSNSTQQTSTLILDIDMDGLNDFVIGARRFPGPSLVWYQRHADGWTKYVIDNTVLSIEAGGAFNDIDGDGDLDIVMGGDSAVNQVWWWENPYPNYGVNTNWTRRLIKNSGATKHHDQMFGDFDGDGRDELVYWNQGAMKLFLAEIPADPRTSGPWPATAIYSWTSGAEHEGLAKADLDGDGLVDIVGGGRWFKFNGGTSFSPNIIDSAQTFTRSAAGQLKEGGYGEPVFVIGDGIGPLKWYEWDGSDWIGHTLLTHDVDHGHSLQVADIDSDGHLDIFVAEMRLHSANPDAKIWIFYGDGQGNFTTSEVSSGFGNHESRVGDLDGDGDIDILGKPYDWETPRVDVWLSDLICQPSLDMWERYEIDPQKPWKAVFVESADLDGDSLEDVITGGWWYKNPGSAGGNWIRNTIGDPLKNVAAVYDFDRDGDVDILGTEGIGSESNPHFVWARNNGSGNFSILSNVEDGSGDFLQGVAVNSFGGSTEEVALSWHQSTKGVQMLSVPADPASQTWAWREISTTTQDEDLSAGDIDRDGDLDLLLGTKWLRNETPDDPDWWDPTWRYRAPINVAANGFARKDKPAEILIDFTSLLASLGQNGEFDVNSIRIIEVDGSNQVLNEDVPFQFDPSPSFNAINNATGTLVIMLDGQTASTDKRHFHVYFDVKGHAPFTPPNIVPRVITAYNVEDAGQTSFKIETVNATYFYHKGGGGFSSLDDTDNNDWISYSTASGSAGEYRGIPNLVYPSDGGYFHPGAGTIISSLIAQGPLKTTIHSATPDNNWQTLWEIYPEYAQMSVLNAETDYWFLYEGTPGGTLDINNDLVVRSNGTQTSAATSWSEAIEGEEWLFFSDPTVGRSLYLAHHEQDNIVDSYRPMNEEMTVFGFGRDGNSRYLQNNNHFTIGLTDQTAHADVTVTSNGASRALGITLGSAESSSIPTISGPWSPFTLSNSSGDPDRNQLADINGDGRLDAIVGYEAISQPGLLAWYEGPVTATNLWTEHSIATIIGPMSVDVADMDGDGDIDIIAGEHNTSNPTSAKLYVFENVDGQGQSWQQHVVHTGDEHHDGAQVVDIDNDGDLDIISIGWTHGRVVVYENKSCTGTLPPQPTPTATSSAPTATSTGPTATASAPTATSTPIDPTSCIPDPNNVLANPGFESGTTSWSFYTNGLGNFDVTSPAFQCEKAARLTLSNVGSNTQFFQRGFLLRGNTRYRLSFAGYSNTGHDIDIYTPYASSALHFDLSQSWQTFSTEFTSTDFLGTTTATRLRFVFSGLASNGDVYWFDDVVLEEVGDSPSPTPPPTETFTATPTATHTATPSHTPTVTQTPDGAATPTPTASRTSTPVHTATSTPSAINTVEPVPTSTPTATATPTDPTSCTPDPNNVLANPGFESGTTSWSFYTNGLGNFDVTSPAFQCEKAARLTLSNVGSNTQFFQRGFLLRGNTRYRLSFAGYSNTGHDIDIYTPYASSALHFDLSQSWQTFSTEFTSTDFLGTTTATRLRFVFSGLASNGDVYWFDDVVLEEVGDSPSPTPPPTETFTATPTATHTATPSHTPTVTQTPDGAATPTPTASRTSTPVHTATSTPSATNTVEPVPTSTPTATATPTDPTSCTPDPNNVLANPGFESGTTSWSFYTNGLGNFDVTSPAFQCEKAARLTLSNVGSNTQFFQRGFLLRGNTRYRLSFAGYSNTGHDIDIYTPYASSALHFDLSQSWQTFSTEFTSTDFLGTTTATRLRFVFTGLASNGDVYWFDDVVLEEVGDSPSPTPPPTETFTATPTATHTATPSHTPTVTQTPDGAATPTPTASRTSTPVHTATSTPSATNTVEPVPTSTPTATATPTDPTSCTPDPNNVLANPGFESGTTSWSFYTNGLGNFDVTSPAFQCEKAARLTLSNVGSNTQFFQRGFLLRGNTRYRLSFAGYSNTGHDIDIYTPYASSALHFDLSQSWQTFSTEFTSTDFLGTTTLTRLRFVFPGLASNGDVYWFDDVQLEETGNLDTASGDKIDIFKFWGSLQETWGYGRPWTIEIYKD